MFYVLKLTGTDVIAIKANDLDAENVNQVFNFNIISVTPESQSVEFYITQTVVADVGIISFRGCLDHEVRELIANFLDL